MESGLEESLLRQFGLDFKAPVSGLSKGQRTQLALIGAIAAEPELLILDEPTSGLDPLVRREFIQTVIGTYQDAVPGRTVFVSTHLITEFEGLIDRFTVLDHGRAVLTADADEARSRYRRVRAEFSGEPPHASEFEGVRSIRRVGKILELVLNGEGDRVLQQVRQWAPVRLDVESLTLEEIFLAALN